MRSLFLKTALILTVVMSWSGAPAAELTEAATTQNPRFQSIGPLAFSPDGVLFAGDTQAGAIVALDLGKAATGGVPGAKAIPAFDQKVAALLGTDVREITVTDLAVHPRTRNAFASVMRGQGTNAQAALLRVDGAGKIDVVRLEEVNFTRVDLPNAPAANPGDQRNARTSSITDMAFVDGRLYVAGLSNEEFSSKLRTVNYPFKSSAAEPGTSVEIYHGNHGQFETRSPVYTFVPYKVKGETNLIAGYLCTPLVKFPVNSLKSGAKVMGTTIAELGNRNRPLDMIVYQKNGKEFLLMSNNSRGVMKIPTEGFADAASITTRVASPTGGVAYESIASMKGVEQLDLLDAANTIVLARTDAGVLNLDVVALP
ncbi:MAG TPA: hypothetical protein VNT81_06645 [Vicinamibacterales bacterium]|nr:hypothetical protein [Vicinamibacterales bacterium]